MQNKTVKMLLWYGGACIIWVILSGFIMTTTEGLYQIYFNYVTLNVGLFAGIFGKELIYKKPWLLMLVPFLYLLARMII